MLRRLFLLAVFAFLSTLVIFTFFNSRPWHPTSIDSRLRWGRGPSAEQIKSGKNILPDLRLSRPGGVYGWRAKDGSLSEPHVKSNSPYPVGETKAPGSNYTKCLVMPKMRNEDVSWVQAELGDMISAGELTTAIYHVDDGHAAGLHPPKNKGNEAMTYLSYIIDSYDSLADINIFMHSHRFAWHNNELLDRDAAQTVRLLSPARVSRSGYMNLRCHWEPGCPEYLFPGSRLQNIDKPEEFVIGEAWPTLFPGTTTTTAPRSLSQPCCAQFAVSRARIRAIPRATFEHLRSWLLHSSLSDYVSGRVFEYTWQYIFAGEATHCPSMRACYCDGFGVCFGSYAAFDAWFELLYERNRFREQLRIWREKAAVVQHAARLKAEGRLWDESALDRPEKGADVYLERKIGELEAEMERRRMAAMERGRDPRARAEESGREWKEGDSF